MEYEIVVFSALKEQKFFLLSAAWSRNYLQKLINSSSEMDSVFIVAAVFIFVHLLGSRNIAFTNR